MALPPLAMTRVWKFRPKSAVRFCVQLTAPYPVGAALYPFSFGGKCY